MKNIIFTLLLIIYAYLATAQNNAIYNGGNGNGWVATTFLQPAINVFAGGSGDGFSFINFLQPGNDIFTGGIGDGWSSAYRPQGTIPVNFIYFTAHEKDGRSVAVKWKTAQETNSAYFDIEHSLDALHYNFIGKVNAVGNSSLPTDYIFIDSRPAKGANYYRLKQVDRDGHFIYTPSRFVQIDELFTASLKYYPNPTKGMVNIELTKAAANEDKVINISSALGIVIDQIKIKRSAAPFVQIDLGNYAKGIYFIQVITATVNSTQRILVQ